MGTSAGGPRHCKPGLNAQPLAGPLAEGVDDKRSERASCRCRSCTQYGCRQSKRNGRRTRQPGKATRSHAGDSDSTRQGGTQYVDRSSVTPCRQSVAPVGAASLHPRFGRSLEVVDRSRPTPCLCLVAWRKPSGCLARLTTMKSVPARGHLLTGRLPGQRCGMNRTGPAPRVPVGTDCSLHC